ncbi:MAG TPA: cytochrome c, partial [Myxococcota bacterium]|nr:cytochrome c [Myxococcota bacterium]
VRGGGRLLVYRLDGDAEPLPPPPPAPPRSLPPPPPPSSPASERAIDRGASTFSEHCAACHGVGAVGGGVTPDLRFMAPSTRSAFAAIVLGGALQPRGMPSFAGVLEPADLRAIRLYLAKRAHAAVSDTKHAPAEEPTDP